MNLHDWTLRIFDDEKWSEQRVDLCKFIISASAGILTLLALSPEKLPIARLIPHWNVYRAALLACAGAAAAGTLLFYFCYRVRYVSRFVRDQLNQNAIPPVPSWIVRTRQLRRNYDVFGFWVSYTLTAILFFLAISASGALVIICLWRPPV